MRDREGGESGAGVSGSRCGGRSATPACRCSTTSWGSAPRASACTRRCAWGEGGGETPAPAPAQGGVRGGRREEAPEPALATLAPPGTRLASVPMGEGRVHPARERRPRAPCPPLPQTPQTPSSPSPSPSRPPEDALTTAHAAHAARRAARAARRVARAARATNAACAARAARPAPVPRAAARRPPRTPPECPCRVAAAATLSRRRSPCLRTLHTPGACSYRPHLCIL